MSYPEIRRVPSKPTPTPVDIIADLRDERGGVSEEDLPEAIRRGDTLTLDQVEARRERDQKTLDDLTADMERTRKMEVRRDAIWDELHRGDTKGVPPELEEWWKAGYGLGHSQGALDNTAALGAKFLNLIIPS